MQNDLSFSDFKDSRIFNSLRIGVVLILLIAAGMKAHHTITSPAPPHEFLASAQFTAIVVAAELFIALLLAIGSAHRLAFALSCVLFSGFGAYSLWSLAAGEPTCGCFGAVKVHPGVPLAIDIVATSGSFWCCWHAVSNATAWRRAWPRIVGSALVAGVSASVLEISAPRALDISQIGNAGSRDAFFIDPNTWVRGSCPIANFIIGGQHLARGRWFVLFYHHDCELCRRALENCMRIARERVAAPAPRIAVVEMPPYASNGLSPDYGADGFLWMKLDESRRWIAETPSAVVVQDGIVEQVLAEELR